MDGDGRVSSPAVRIPLQPLRWKHPREVGIHMGKVVQKTFFRFRKASMAVESQDLGMDGMHDKGVLILPKLTMKLW